MIVVETMFCGYLRPDNTVGIRNYLGVIPTVNCCNELSVRIANSLENAIPLPHTGRCVFLGKDQDRLFQLLIHIGKNPNLGAVMVVGSGCEPHSAEKVAHEISLSKKPVDLISIKDWGHYDLTFQKGEEISRALSEKIIYLKKDFFPFQYVTLAIKCGGSDTTSGIAGNIIAGMIADYIVQRGGKVLFTETPELIGAEQILVKRSKNNQVAQKLLAAVQRQEKRMLAMGVDIRRCEPTPGNIQGGLTTIEEKSLGAVTKTGQSVLMDVLESGQLPEGSGLYFIDGPSHTTEIFSNMAAAGAQTLLFSIGGGVPASFPIGPAHSGQFPIMPVIRMSGNPHQPQHVIDSMDINVSSIISEGKDYADVFPETIDVFTHILSGEKTKAEKRTSYIETMNFYFEGPLI